MDNDTYSLSDAFKQNSIFNIYIWLSEPTYGKNILWGVTLSFISQMIGEIGWLFLAKGRLIEGKIPHKEKKSAIWLRCVIGRDTW